MSKNKTNKKSDNKAAGSTQQKDAQLIHRVIRKQESITRKDIADWKKARQQASSAYAPKQVLLQNLYDEVMLDPLMTSQIGLRIDKSQGSDFALKINGEVDEQATLLFKDSGLYEAFVECVIESKFHGSSVVELSYEQSGLELELIPRAHISPAAGKFYPDVSGDLAISYREVPEFGSWLLEFYPRKYDLGLLNKAVPYVLVKKFTTSCWSELCEILGIPPRVMKTNTTDQGMLQQAEKMMREIGSAAYFIIDTTEEFEFAKGADTNGDAYKNLIAMCDQQLSLLNLGAVLGQDTENGNRSKEESSSLLMESIVKADQRLIESYFNKTVLPALAAIGFLKPGLRLEIAKEVDVAKFWKMVTEAADRWDVDPQWVKDTFGIEIVGRKDEVPPEEDDPEDDQDPQDNTEEGNDKEERGFFLYAPLDGALNGKTASDLSEGLLQRVASGESDYWDAELFWYFAGDFLKAVKTSFKNDLKTPVGKIAYNAPDDVYMSAMEQNLFHFSAAKTLAEVQELNQIFRLSSSYDDFKNKALDVCSAFNDKWQRTEYRTAVQVAESASSYRQLKSKVGLFPIWVYRTVGDGQVRPEHAALDGLTLLSNDPAWSKIYPPNDWGCRCWVDALMADEHEGGYEDQCAKVEEFMESAEWKRSVAQGWGTNRAESAEVFTSNQMYIKKFPNKAASYLGKLHYNDFGLDSFGKRVSQSKSPFVPFSGNPQEWHAKNSAFKDFSGKTIQLSGDVFKVHTGGKYTATRVPLLGSISDVLQHPDEVWINDFKKGFDNLNYIKFYQGKVVNVVCGIHKGRSLQVETWFEIEQTPKGGGKLSRAKDPRWRYRRGLLIKK